MSTALAPATPVLSDPPQLYGQHFEHLRSVRGDQGPLFYTLLRQRYGDVAPVEITPGVRGHLVLTKRATDDIVHSTDGLWTKDQRIWEAGIPVDSPIRGVFRYREHPVSADGETHRRYRAVINDVFRPLLQRPHHMQDLAKQVCDDLIDGFDTKGNADLIEDYARLIPLHLVNRLVGFPDKHAHRLRKAMAGHIETQADAERASQEFEQYVHDLLNEKEQRPGEDIATWILHHPSLRTRTERHDHLTLTIGAGHEPTANLIGNAILRILLDDRYYAALSDGVLTADAAIQEVLRDEPPMADHCPWWPTENTRFYGTDIRAHSIVLISLASVNADAARPGACMGARGHYAFGAGAHMCPVRRLAELIARTAITCLIQRCTNLQTTLTSREHVAWRPGFVLRGPANLPATFTRITAPTARTPRHWRGPGSRFLRLPANSSPGQCPVPH